MTVADVVSAVGIRVHVKPVGRGYRVPVEERVRIAFLTVAGNATYPVEGDPLAGREGQVEDWFAVDPRTGEEIAAITVTLVDGAVAVGEVA